MSGLDVLGERVKLLLKKYAALQSENKSLKKALAKSREELDVLKEQLEATRQETIATSIVKALPDKKERTVARKQIDAVINEIDKILINLND